ncbi:MAG: ABC transporter ATP-binding protein [Bacteroidia bacterium]
MLRAENIHKRYGNLEVLRGVSLEVFPGEVAALVGASGAGKSTLLHILGTLDNPDAGTVYFQNSAISEQSEKAKALFRNKSLGFVFQFHHLLPEFTALENVCMPAYIQGGSRSVLEKRGEELLDRLGLSDRLDHKPSQLSGGEQQRVSVARALMNEPQIILADEPTGNLDTVASDRLFNLMLELAQDTGVGFLMVTHDRELASRTHRLHTMRDGMNVASATPQQ